MRGKPERDGVHLHDAGNAGGAKQNGRTSYHDQLLRAGTGHKGVGVEVTRGQTGQAPGQPGILEGEEAWQEEGPTIFDWPAESCMQGDQARKVVSTPPDRSVHDSSSAE